MRWLSGVPIISSASTLLMIDLASAAFTVYGITVVIFQTTFLAYKRNFIYGKYEMGNKISHLPGNE